MGEWRGRTRQRRMMRDWGTEKNDARWREMETLTTAAVLWPEGGRTPRHRRYLSLREGLGVVFLAEQKSMSFTDVLVLSRCFWMNKKQRESETQRKSGRAGRKEMSQRRSRARQTKQSARARRSRARAVDRKEKKPQATENNAMVRENWWWKTWSRSQLNQRNNESKDFYRFLGRMQRHLQY